MPWPGNAAPRIAETYGGMINAIGLQNPGIDVFVKRDIPYLRQFDTKIIVNVCGKTTEDYVEVVERLRDEPVDLLEINISCPNVKEGGIAFGQDPKAVEAITREVKRRAKQPIIMKLSPNVTDITEMARAAKDGGADALSLINTLTGMKIDVHRRAVRPGHPSRGGADGISDGQCRGSAHHRHGWDHDGGRCPGIYPGGSHGCFRWHGQFPRSLRDG